MKRYLHTVTFLAIGAVSWSAHAEDLMQIYKQALQSDPVFAQAESTWRSQKMNLPIAEAGYLPQVSIGGNVTRNYQQINPNVLGGVNGYSWQYGYSLTATQPIFNFAVWQQIKGASASVK